MATIKLKPKSKPAPHEAALQGRKGTAASATPAQRPPVRSNGPARPRPTLAQAQSAREEREARWQEQLRQRYGDRPPPPAFPRDASDTRTARDDPRARPAPSSRPAGPGGAPPFAGRGRPPGAIDREPQRGEAWPRDQRSGRRPEGRNVPSAPAPRHGRADAAAPQPFDAAPRRGAAPAPRHVRDEPDARGAGQGRHGRQGTDPRDSHRPPPQPGQRFDVDPRRSGSPLSPPATARKNTAFDPRRVTEPARPAGPSARHGPRDRNAASHEQRGRDYAARGRHDDDDDDHAPASHAPGSLRLSKRMSELGIASRREADEWIAQGWVRVDDQVVRELGSRVVPGQRITVDAKAKFQQAQRVTVLVNKPVGYVSGQAEDGYEPAVVLVTAQNQWQGDHSGTRYLKAHLQNLVPAGRLDIDSVGLLVLTQDGRVAKQLIGETSEVEKEYLVRVAMAPGARLPPAQLALLRHGLELDGEALRPAHVEWVNADQLRFVLTQGKKRQIRRMCEAVGLQVLGLKRVRIGDVMLGDLPPGQWRYLRADEAFAPKPTAVAAAATVAAPPVTQQPVNGAAPTEAEATSPDAHAVPVVAPSSEA
jgi:23S rRNA pseudouridine2604 synthase